MKTINPREAARAAEARELQLVDIRPPEDVADYSVEHALNIPFGQLERRIGELDQARPVAFLCRAGVRSQDAAQLATDRGFDALSVDGGADAWRQQVPR